MNKRITHRLVTSAATLISLVLVGACNPLESISGSSVNASPSPPDSGKKSGTAQTGQRKIAATVDDQPIYEDELAPVIQTGVDRAIALDRAINRAITARAARQQFEKEAQQVVDVASREVLSQLYLQKATQRLSEKVTDREIKEWYDRRITPEDYREYQATYALVGSAEDAARVAADAARGDKKTLAQFRPVTDQPDQWLKARDFPYGLGQLVSRMKPGEISKPVALRNGWFVLMVKQTREQPPPTLESVKTEIRNVLVSEALARDINQIRQTTRIELK